MVERFLEDLRAGRAAPEATGEMLAQALGDPGLELLFWLPAGEVYVDVSGRVVEGTRRTAAPARLSGAATFPLATVVHDEALGARPDLLESVIGAAGLAIEIARLRVEVRRQLADVEESRARIVTAGYEERRRLERDLHDGAQQRLVSIGLALRHLQGQLPAASPQAATLDATVAELARAIEELRELARGVRPAGLDDGLAPALRDLASRSRLRTSVEATDERFEDRVETAAYFFASEASPTPQSTRRRPALPSSAGAAERQPGGLGPRRRRGRRRPSTGLRAGRDHRPCGCAGRKRFRGQPARTGNDRHGGASVRVMIAEDQALLREGLGRLFADAGHDVVAAVGDADRLRAAISEHEPDLAVVDVRMPPSFTDEGIRAGAVDPRDTPRRRRAGAVPARGGGWAPSGSCPRAASATCSRTGCWTSRTSSRPPSESPRAARHSIRRSLPRSCAGNPRMRSACSPSASARCCRSMAEGLTNSAIARRLVLTERTVEGHVRSVLMKLDLPTSDDAHRRVLAVVAYLRAADSKR